MVRIEVEMEHAYVRGITVDQLNEVLRKIEDDAKKDCPSSGGSIHLEANEGDEGAYQVTLDAEKEALAFVKGAVDKNMQAIPAASRYWYIGILGALSQEIGKELG